MDQSERLAAFEAMLEAVQRDYAATCEKMRSLREQGREKTATYRQLMGNRLQCQSTLTLYKVYGLIDEMPGAR